jgi:hypothetical protein
MVGRLRVKFDGRLSIHRGRAVLALTRALRPLPSLMLDNLPSKVIAAGLAAGVFLLWWPAHLPSTGVQWLVLRGLAWTLAFEVLALSFVPLERMAARAMTRRRSAGRADRVRSRLAAAPAPARASGAVILAFTGLLLPGLLLLHTGHLAAKPAAAHATQVVRQVVVRKVVHERTVVVREVAPAAEAAPVQARAAVRQSTPVPTRAAAKAPATKAPARTVAAKPAPATAPAPADPAALPNPAEPAAPVADVAAPADVPAGG